MESGIAIVLGAQAGVNMSSGAGMLDFLACQSVEKLVLDAEAIASAQRLIRGVEPRRETLATTMFALTGLGGDFLSLKETRTLFREEQHFPAPVIDRGGSLADDGRSSLGRGKESISCSKLINDSRCPPAARKLSWPSRRGRL